MAFAEFGDDGESGIERLFMFADDEFGLGCEGFGVHGGDEDGVGFGVDRRYFAEGACAEGRPEAGLDQQRANFVAAP